MIETAPKITVKQRKWLAAYIETGNATEAARQAGYSGNDETLYSIGHQNMKKLTRSIHEMLDRMGLSDAALIKKLQEGLNATVVETGKFEGKITDERSYPDYAARFKYLEMAFRLRGAFPSDKVPEALPEALALLRDRLGVTAK
jgi:hypothetical protein